MAERRRGKKRSKKKRYVLRFFGAFIKWMFVLCLICGIAGAGVGAVVVHRIIKDAPEIDMNSLVPQGYATTVYDSAGNAVEVLVMEGSNRESATFEELPENLIDAFVAYEDSRFWKHKGIDIRSILRAVKGVLTHDSSAGGGSTITQQLIKNNVFNGGMEKTFSDRLQRKIQEQYLALQVEKAITKEQIITNYLNTINLGNNTLGVKVAARRYFNKEVSDLTLSECAVLAGISQNPSKFNPISGQAENARKQKVILKYMEEQKLITEAEKEAALQDDVYSRIQSVDVASKETATPYSYFTDELIDQVKTVLMTNLGYTENQAYNLLYGGGLSIYSTQDPAIQAIVDEEINNPDNYTKALYAAEYRLSVTHADGTTEHFSQEHIKKWHKEVLNDTDFESLYGSEEDLTADIEAYKAYQLKEGDTILGEKLNKTLQPQASFVIMDQKTGQVKAISGGRGAKTASLTLNRATNTLRQPGSTFKIVTSFAPAVDTGKATLGTVYYDTPFTVGKKTFSNWYGKQGFLGYSNIRDGIIYSMNIVAVRCLMETVTPPVGTDYASRFGITSLRGTDENAALALGGLTDGVSNLELTGAYATIANEGKYNKPVLFTRILDHDGKLIYESQPENSRVIKDSTAFLITDAMTGVMKASRIFARPGVQVSSTGTRAAIPGMSAAGKSGTTTSNRDLWFVGYTPYYTAGIWSGYDSNQVITGGTSYHKDIWQKIMARVHEGMPDPGFPVPDSVVTAQICRKSGKLAVEGVCSADPRGSTVYTEYFAKGAVPVESCDKHVRASICTESGLQATPYCPSSASGIFMVIPDEEGVTDDSIFAAPGYCNIHDGTATAVDEPDLSDGDTDIPSTLGPGESPGPGSSNWPGTGQISRPGGGSQTTKPAGGNQTTKPAGGNQTSKPGGGTQTGRPGADDGGTQTGRPGGNDPVQTTRPGGALEVPSLPQTSGQGPEISPVEGPGY